MPQETLKTKLKKLPLIKKLVLGGSFLAVISVFMPWYKDIDAYKTGDMFLGITGPTYLAGLIIFFGSLVTFGLVATKLLEKPLPKLPINESYLNIFVGSLSVLMLILASSVYFHPKFGTNLTEKTMGIGMILDFAGSILVLTAGIVELRKKDISFEVEGELKPLISVENRTQASIEPKEVMQKVGEDASRTANMPFSHVGTRPNGGRDMAEESIRELYSPNNKNHNDPS